MHQVISLKVSRGNFINYSYLLIDVAGQTAAVVDPAWEFGTIVSALQQYNVSLESILLTHSHFDHVDLVPALVQKFSPKVYIGRVEARAYRYSCENIHWVEDQQSILVGQIPVKVVLTPGHSSGGVCYWADGDLFTGDTLFSEGCGICDQAGGSPSAMFDSFQKLRNLIPRETRIWPGHSFGKEPGMTLAEVIETNIYFHLLDREEFIRFRMRNSPLDPMRFQ